MIRFRQPSRHLSLLKDSDCGPHVKSFNVFIIMKTFNVFIMLKPFDHLRSSVSFSLPPVVSPLLAASHPPFSAPPPVEHAVFDL